MRWPSFEELLKRADEVVLQELLGRPALRLLQSLLGSDISVRRLRELLLELHPPLGLLLALPKRTLLIDLLRPDEARALVNELELPGPATSSPFTVSARSNLTSGIFIAPASPESGSSRHQAFR